MLSYSQAYYRLVKELQPLYDEREAAAIAHELLLHITGLDRTQRLIRKDTVLTQALQQQYDLSLTSLKTGRPLQYVTHSSWFMGREYYVNEHVLIPRPETEELVQWISDDWAGSNKHNRMLDIGTGSGCIPISLKLSIPLSDVAACDISGPALEVAKKNAQHLKADIHFSQIDFLNPAEHNKLGTYDVIVSNPPYIPISEKEKLHDNVKNHEPGLALFVPDSDALIFYRVIALFGKAHLNSIGYIYCELDAAHAMECKVLFEQEGYKSVEIRKDMHGNWRMLRAVIG